jgi:PAS domain S-box-containing protein
VNDALIPPRPADDFYRTIFDVAGEAIVICSEAGVAIDCNQAATQLLNCTRDRLIGSRPIDWSPELQPNGRSSSEMANEFFARAKTNGVVNFEWEHLRSNGRPLPVDVTLRLEKINDRNIFVVISRDISKYKESEAQLLASKESLKEAQKIANVGYYVYDRVSDKWTSSDVLDEIFGIDSSYPRDFENWIKLVVPESREQMRTYFSSLVNERNSFDCEYRVARPSDGEVRWVHGMGNLRFDSTGEPLSMIGTIQDITKRKNEEEKLQLARQIFETANEAIFVSDLDGNLLDVNPAACRLAKYRREDLLRLRNVDIVAKGDIPRIAPELAECDDGAIVENRWMLLCSDGSTVPLELAVQRLPSDRYIAIGRDLTERESALRELARARDIAESANLAKSRFLAAASHDLRQPVLAINLFQNALGGTALNEEQKLICQRLSLSVKSLGEILDELLDVSFLDGESVKPVFEAVNSDILFRKIELKFSHLALAKSLRFKLFSPVGEVKMLADMRFLDSLLSNLIGNAIKYTEHGGVLVGIRRRGDKALIQVWDSGLGIEKSQLGNIFEEYFQINNPERNQAKGLGLGLSIVKRLASLLNTEVVCKSKLGQGSVFEFQLPLSS